MKPVYLTDQERIIALLYLAAQSQRLPRPHNILPVMHHVRVRPHGAHGGTMVVTGPHGDPSPWTGEGAMSIELSGEGAPPGGQKIGPPPASSPPLPEGMNEPGFFHELGPFEPKAGDSLAPPRFR